MLTLIHGDNQVASRNALAKLVNHEKNNKKEIIKLEGVKLTLNHLKQALESHSLFGLEKVIVIENIFSRIKSKEKDEIVNYLKKEKHYNDIFIWEKNIVHHSTVKSLPKNSKVHLFKVSPLIFKFLDSLNPKNIKNSLSILLSLKKTDPAEMVFYMLSRRISDLIMVSELGKQGLNGMQDWQKVKLLKQSKNFSSKALINFHEKIFKLDNDIKTGKNILPLSSQLDLILLEI